MTKNLSRDNRSVRVSQKKNDVNILSNAFHGHYTAKYFLSVECNGLDVMPCTENQNTTGVMQALLLT